MPIDLPTLLARQLKANASDLHLVTGEAPLLRLPNSKLVPLEGEAVLTQADIESVITILGKQEGLERFHKEKEFEIGFSGANTGRFRATFYEESNGPAAAIRAIPLQIPTPEELEIPQVILDTIDHQDGLVLITGPNGHGKSTTLASLVDYINARREAHIITIEDPIEFVFERKQSVISQRAVGQDTKSFSAAVKHTLRQDVDVIVVGEMRDLETISTVLTLAETGHLVLATLHTHDAPRAVQRIIDVFPAAQQSQIALQLSHSLTAVMSQRLIPAIDGESRACAREIMLVNDGIRNAIREHKLSELYSQIQINREAGMCPFDDSLLDLIERGLVSADQVKFYAQDPKQLKARLKK